MRRFSVAKLRGRMNDLGLSARSLADKSDLTCQSICSYLGGACAPRADSLMRLVAALELDTIDDLFEPATEAVLL